MDRSQDTGDAKLTALKQEIARERSHQSGVSLSPSKTEPYWACPESACEAIVDPPARRADGHWELPQSSRALEGSGVEGGYDPQDLRSAYDIPASGGEQQQRYEETQTIALIDVGYDETAESDLSEYRAKYGLAPCTKTGGCFREVTELGEEGHPQFPDPEWELETSLDLDMASAACPHCHILLVQANSETLSALAASANTAAKLGATEISNSYGLPELGEECGASHCTELAADYDHPGVVIVASAGDGGWDNYLRRGTSPLFPAVAPTVIAVGGTSLRKAKRTAEGRKWLEAVWNEPHKRLGTGSGCSTTEPKPSWQKDSGCAGRTDNDVAVVGACETPVSIYSSYYEGWINVCGTSAGSPLVAGMEAHAGETAGSAVPTADAFYQERSSLFDVTSGVNGECSPTYLCSAETQVEGYDGPTGNGTPYKGPVAVAGEAPSVRTEQPGAGGEVNGVIDPNGLATTYCFEYGTTTSYGACAPASEASAGSATAPKAVSEPLTGLPPGLYHYRLAATNQDGRSYGEDQIIDTRPPAVTAIAPAAGWNIGGARVRIAGTDFVDVTAVRFGSTPATSFHAISETEVEAEAPPGAGTVDVTVETVAGTSANGEADRFAYEPLPPPTVSGLDPDSGWTQGSTVVTIAGTDFAGVSAVDFGSTPATSFEVVSETQIEAVAPAGTGTVDVTVTTPGGTSATGSADEFAYELASSLGEPAWLSSSNLAEAVPSSAFPGPDVAVDGRGDAAAVWKTCNASGEECEAESGFVDAAVKPAGGSWSASVRVSGAGNAYDKPQVAIDERGDAVAVFDLYSYPGTSEVPAGEEIVQAAFRPAGGEWQKPVTLSPRCSLTAFSDHPQVAVDPAGDAVATWRCRLAGTERIVLQAARMSPAGGWQAPVTLAEKEKEQGNETLGAPVLALDSHGDAFAAWTAGGYYAGESEMAYRPADGGWQAPETIDATGGEPVLAVNARGDAWALVHQDEGFAAAYRPHGGSWQAPTEVAPRGQSGPYAPDLAVDSQGDAVAVWWEYKGEYDFIRAAHKAGSGNWQRPVTLNKNCWAWAFCLPQAQVVLDDHGDAVAIWQHEGSGRYVTLADRLPAKGGWLPPVQIPSTGGANEAELGLDAQGNGVAVWEAGFGKHWSVETAPYVFAPPPTVTKIEPDRGPASGGTSVTIVGEHLNAAAVHFGSTEAASLQVESETQLKAVSPPGTGKADVTVTTPEGTSLPDSADEFVYQASPEAITGDASSLGRFSARLNATVDPEGLAVSDCHFEYGSSPAYGSSVPCSQPPGSGGDRVVVSAPVDGLNGFTTYYFRVVATNADGTSYGSAQTFQTLPAPPTVTERSASAIEQTTATLNATVNANEEALSECQFEYGTSSAYGATVPCSPQPKTIESSEPVSARLSGLSPDTSYHFRIEARNGGGTSYGSDQTFDTAAPALPELGRCLNLGYVDDKYTSAACTTVATGTAPVTYEWEPWPAARNRFTGKGGVAGLETAAKAKIRCGESVLAGEYTGSQTAVMSVTFTGCAGSHGLTGTCQSEGASAGQIQTAPLEAKLGVIKATKNPTVGWELSAASQPDVAKFECGAQTIAVAGSAIAPVKKTDDMSTTFTLTYKGKKGHQSPERFAAGLNSALTLLSEGTEEQAGLTTTITLTSEEPLEIKAVA